MMHEIGVTGVVHHPTAQRAQRVVYCPTAGRLLADRLLVDRLVGVDRMGVWPFGRRVYPVDVEGRVVRRAHRARVPVSCAPAQMVDRIVVYKVPAPVVVSRPRNTLRQRPPLADFPMRVFGHNKEVSTEASPYPASGDIAGPLHHDRAAVLPQHRADPVYPEPRGMRRSHRARVALPRTSTQVVLIVIIDEIATSMMVARLGHTLRECVVVFMIVRHSRTLR